MVWIRVEEGLSSFRQRGCKSMINTKASYFSILIDYCSWNNNVINSRKIVFITKTLIILYNHKQLKVDYHLMKGKSKDKSRPLSKGNKSQRGRGEVDMK